MIPSMLPRVAGTTGLVAIFCVLGLAPASVRAQDVIVDRDVAYYDGPEFYAPRHILDIYRLEGSKNSPVLMFIHGGAWTGGNKSQFAFLGNFFARQGYVAVLANYRLTDNSPGRVMHPGHITDVARAFAWTYANIADYGGNPDKIFLSGHSAGGHLVALLGTDPRYLANHGLTQSHIAGVIGVSGVYDVRGITNVFGQNGADASPMNHVFSGSPPPFLVLFAENDLGDLALQGIYFYIWLFIAEADTEWMWFAGRNHGSIITNIANPDDPVAALWLEFMANR